MDLLNMINQFCKAIVSLKTSLCVFTGVSGSNVCPVDINAVDDSVNESVPRLRYLRLDGNEIKPPIPRDVILCFRLLRSIVI